MALQHAENASPGMAGEDAPERSRLRIALDAARMAVWEIDLASDSVVGSPELNRVLGFPAEATPTLAEMRARYAPGERERVSAVGAEALARGERFFETEFRVEIPAEGPRWLLMRAEIVLGSDGTPARVVGVLMDISSRKRTEEALAASEARLQLAKHAIGLGVWDWDLLTGRIEWSPEMFAILGLDPFLHASDPYSGWLSVLHPDDREEQDALTRRSAARGEPFSRVFRIVRQGTGETRWIRTDATVVRDAAGAPVRVVGVNLDVTEQKRAEDALRASQDELRIITDSLPELISFVDSTGIYRFANKAYESWYGHDPREVVGRPVREVLGEEGYAVRLPFIEAALRGEECSLDVAIPQPDGRMRLGEARYLPHFTPDGQVDGFHAYVIDITQRKKAEEALQRLNESLEAQVEERTRDLRAAEEALRHAQKMEAIGQLTGGLAHDFNNMLGAIMGGLDLIRKRLAAGRTAEVGRFIEAATASAERAAGLTQRLLAFARRQSLDTKPVDVNRLVASMEDLLRRTMGGRIAIRIDLDPQAWIASTDANQVESAILNLAINARDAMPEEGTLRISTGNARLDGGSDEGGFVMVAVQDTGCGMDEQTLLRAFDPFFTTKPIGQGTGLGLSMVYGFANQAGGRVDIESAPGKGTLVRLYLPRHVGTAADASHPAAIAGHQAQDGQTILVVEDETALRMLVAEHLQDLGYRVLEAADGRSAVPILTGDARIDLMASDVGLPGMNGRQLAEVARQHRPGLPVLLMTGYAEGASERGGFLGPGIDLLVKPFVMDELGERIRSMLGAAAAGSSGRSV